MVSKPRREDVAPAPDVRPRRAPPVAVMSAGGTWSGARLEKFVRQTPGAMELRLELGRSVEIGQSHQNGCFYFFNHL